MGKPRLNKHHSTCCVGSMQPDSLMPVASRKALSSSFLAQVLGAPAMRGMRLLSVKVSGGQENRHWRVQPLLLCLRKASGD